MSLRSETLDLKKDPILKIVYWTPRVKRKDVIKEKRYDVLRYYLSKHIVFTPSDLTYAIELEDPEMIVFLCATARIRMIPEAFWVVFYKGTVHQLRCMCNLYSLNEDVVLNPKLSATKEDLVKVEKLMVLIEFKISISTEYIVWLCSLGEPAIYHLDVLFRSGYTPSMRLLSFVEDSKVKNVILYHKRRRDKCTFLQRTIRNL